MNTSHSAGDGVPSVGIMPRQLIVSLGRDLLAARPRAFRLLAFFLLYVLAAGFAETMAITPGTGISIWPPAGLFMAVLLLHPRATWPWWIATALSAELCASAIWFHNPLATALLLSIGNALAAMTGALLLRGPRPLDLVRLRQIAYLLVAGAVIAPAVSASVGAATLWLLEDQAFSHAWQLWWIGDATGVLIVAPIVLVAARTSPSDWVPRRRTLEIALVALAFAAAAAMSLSGRLPFAYLVMPPLLWAAIRFRFKGAISIVAGLALMTGLFTFSGTSPFAGAAISERDTQVMLQLFLAVSALSAWCVAAVSHQQRLAVEALEAANRTLEARIEAKTQRLQASERAARDHAEEIEAIYDAAPVGLVLFDRALRFERINQRLARINHRAVEDHIGRLVEEVLPAATVEAVRSAVDRLEAGEEVVELEIGGPDPSDGAVRHWLLSYQAIRDEVGKIAKVVGAVAEITERKRHEERADFVLREVSHRSKNLLALVSAVARQSLRGSAAEREAFARLERRLRAIAAGQDVLVQGAGTKGAAMAALARAQLAHFEELIGERIQIGGPDLTLNENAASAIGMALHELATNAGKYGALSSDQGSIDLSWRFDGARFTISWIERGGPIVSAPARRGFGSEVIERMVAQSTGGEVSLRYPASGLVWTLDCSTAQVAVSPLTEMLPLDGDVTRG